MLDGAGSEMHELDSVLYVCPKTNIREQCFVMYTRRYTRRSKIKLHTPEDRQANNTRRSVPEG